MKKSTYLSKRKRSNNSSSCETSFGGGYSLAELAIAVAILSILAIFTIPSGINLLRRERLRKANIELKNFSVSARKNAMLYSTSCQILVNSPSPGMLTVSEVGSPASTRCANAYGDSKISTIDLRTYASDPSIAITADTCSGTSCMIGFNYRGGSLSPANRTITISSDLTNGHRRCLLITSPVGFTRMGSQELEQTFCTYTKTS